MSDSILSQLLSLLVQIFVLLQCDFLYISERPKKSGSCVGQCSNAREVGEEASEDEQQASGRERLREYGE